MKHFIYTYHEETKRGGYAKKTVRIYRIVRGVPKFLGDLTESFVCETQLVMMALEHLKALPARAFERHPMGGYALAYAYQLETAKLCTIHRVL